MRRFLIAVIFLLGTSFVCSASATTVYVISIGSREVQIVVNGRDVRTLKIGQETPEGVSLTGIGNNAALLQVDGKNIALGLGQSTHSETSIKANANGEFFTTAYINGNPVRTLIDTGATNVSLNMNDARQLRVDFTRARRDITQTANGAVPIYLVTLSTVQVGDIALTNVPATILDGPATQNTTALIGMSFLKHVDMRRSGDTMTLLRAH